jgi:hypothetical protein
MSQKMDDDANRHVGGRTSGGGTCPRVFPGHHPQHLRTAYLAEQSLGAPARAHGEVDVHVVVLRRHRLLHERLGEHRTVHLDGVVRLHTRT